MAGTVFTFTSVGSSRRNDGAIVTSQGTVLLGQSGLFLPTEYQAVIGDGLVLVAGPAASPAAHLTAPTVAAGAAGTPSGTYKCAVTFVTAAGETKIGPEATVTVTSQQISWSNIPVATAQSGVIARKLYRTAAGGASGTEKLVTTINDNSTTTFATDNVADGSLGASIPASDTSAVLGGVAVATQVEFAELTGIPSDDAFVIGAGTGAKVAPGGSSTPTGPAGGDLSGTFPNPSVAKVNGVAVSGTPVTGQVPTATSGTAATWQTPSGGGAVASVFTRTGAVVAQSGDYTAAQVTSAADKSAAGQQAFTGEVASPDFKPLGLTGAVAASRYVGATTLGAPTTGNFLLGDWVTDQAGKRWTCTVAGTPGTWAQEPGTGGGGSVPTIQGAQSTNFGATQTVNFAGTASEIWLVGTFNANLVVTVSNRVAGCRLRIQGLQDGTGGRTLTISDGTNSQSVTIASAASAYTEVLVDCPDATNVNASVVGANGPVSSVFGRTGAVAAASGDYTAAQVTNAADKSSASQQAFTGELAAPDFSATGLTGATAASRHVGGTVSGAPVSGTFLKGDFVIDQSGKVWVCTTAGSPGTWGQIGGGGGASYVGVFGDGSDGALTFDGTSTVAGLVPASNIYVMTADLHATSITVNAGVTLQPAGFRVLCQGTVTNSGTISANGGNATGAVAGGGGIAGTLGGGGAGAAGGTGAGVGGSGGFAGGKGGTGGASGGNGGGAAGNATLNTAALAKSYLFTPGPVLAGLVAQTGSSKVLTGGSGGGSGGGDGTNAGGGSGGGGGIIAILAHAIVNNGTITANGGNGGNAAGSGTAAGGGGGGGGAVLGYTLSAWTAGTINVNGGAAGTGGSGTGASGNAGNAGYSQNVVLA